MQDIELHIDELVLHGIAPGDRHRVAGAVQQELTRLFAEQGLPAALSGEFEVERLNAGDFVAGPGVDAATIGRRVARAVYGGMTHD
jgi:hypothetical protein